MPERGRRAASRSSTSPTRSPAAASRGCSRSPSRPTTSAPGLLYVYYTDTGGRPADRRVPRSRRTRVADPRAPASCSRSTTSPPTTTAACCSSAPTASSTPGTGDGGGGGRSGAHRARTSQSPLGKLLRDRPRDPAASPRSPRSGCATRGGSPSTARPATCGSATSARTRWRRSTPSPPPSSAASSNFGWSAFEGSERVQRRPGGAGRDRADARVRPRRRAAR